MKHTYDKETGRKEDKKVTGYVARAEDAAPFAANGKKAHENLRLDYKNTAKDETQASTKQKTKTYEKRNKKKLYMALF